MEATVTAERRAQKMRLTVAAVVFGLWVAGLAGMALTSGRRPQDNPPRPAASP